MNNDLKNANLEQLGTEMAEMLNYKKHAEILNVPIIQGFEIKNDNNPQTILLAAKEGFVEQLVSDGPIGNDNFEDRVNLVINNTKQFMKNNSEENVDNSFIYYKDYSNGLFNFKIYVCDMVMTVTGERKIIRQFNAYFVEPKMRDFYQLSLSAGPFAFPTEQLKAGTLDLVNDQTTILLNNLMQVLMDNLKYKQ